MSWHLKTDFGSMSGTLATWDNPKATFAELRDECKDRHVLPDQLNFHWEPCQWERGRDGVYRSDGWTAFKNEESRAAVVIPSLPYRTARMNRCYANAERAVRAWGGKWVVGRAVKGSRSCLLVFEHHAVWRHPTEGLVCVSPRGYDSITFVPQAEYEAEDIPQWQQAPNDIYPAVEGRLPRQTARWADRAARIYLDAGLVQTLEYRQAFAKACEFDRKHLTMTSGRKAKRCK